MAKTSKYEIALDIIRGKIADDYTLQSVNVFTKETVLSNTKANVYTNIISDDIAEDLVESRYSPGLRKMRVGCYAIQKNPLDSQELGTAAIAHGVLAEKLDRVMDAVASSLPYTDTTDQGYSITLHSIETNSVTGYVDDKSDKVALLYEITFTYLQQ